VLRRAQLALSEDLLAKLAAEDMRATQYAVLTVLGANPGLRQNQVCAAPTAFTSPPTATSFWRGW